MSIIFNEKKKIFYLHSRSTSYIMGLLEGNLVHIYWGKRLESVPEPELSVPHCPRPQALYTDPCRRDLQKDTLPLEFSTYGNTDLRNPTVHIQYADGSTVSEFEYVSHEITEGKPALDGLPSTFDCRNEAQTLVVRFADRITKVEVLLSYTVFENKDAITRHIEIINNGPQSAKILSCMSMSVDFADSDYEAMTLCGAVQRERYVQREALGFGTKLIESRRGASGHQRNPFFALARKNTTENSGEIYGINFVYSGNFVAGADVDCYNSTRLYMGINPFDFSWQLSPKEKFVSPEAVMVYSDGGIGKMSRIFHRLYRENLCPGKWALCERPVKINSWETAMFDFDESKLLALAENAKKTGADMLVLDDGWFGRRNDDTTSLGDWFVNTQKLPEGLSSLADKLRAMDMKLGIWVEPEMISEESELYRKHPDWCIHVNGRKKTYGRAQLVLDLSRREVCDYIVSVMTEVFESADISYVKWDMNRNMTDIGSEALPPERQRETSHRYILGLYYILDKLTAAFPHILFESCAAGGGRFDAGMLYYMPQTWASDNSDACDRAKIQYGTSIVYPPCTMSAHVSKVPNVVNKRITPINSRCNIAMMGQFGFEFDLSKLSEEDFEYCTKAVADFKKYRNIIHFGDMYRLSSPFETNNAVWQFVSEDKNDVLIIIFNTLSEVNGAFHSLKLEGLEENSCYFDEENNIDMSGDALMKLGIYFRNTADFDTKVYHFKKRETN